MSKTETLEGYIADIACLRRYPRAAWAEKARTHTKTCSLEGHCLESGFGLVGEDGEAALLDSEATPRIAELVRRRPRERGIRARVTRRQRDGDMETFAAEELPSPSNASGESRLQD